MTSPRFMVVTVTFHEREDGGMRVSSADLPGLLLSGSDKEHVFKMIAPSIGALLKRKGIAPVHVECAISLDEALKRSTPCDVDMHVRSQHERVYTEEFVIELPLAA
ncbi:hypothetical protein [Brevundimonas sp.]|uniref:hypothetical protein n=1 Tax=Brevundimonas sp. TaxID=1871086 RepID=UPI003BAC8515